MTLPSSDWLTADCQPMQPGATAMTRMQAVAHLERLSVDWQLDQQATQISRRFTVKGYAKTLLFVNALAFLADRQGHHPDICFGWGYCQLTFTTHDVGGLSLNDFICAAKVDSLATP